MSSSLQHAIDDFERNGVKLAAVLFCTAFSSEGLPDIPRTYFPKVAAAVHAAGGLVIADEVQAGFGRFGSHMWGHDRAWDGSGHRHHGQAHGQWSPVGRRRDDRGLMEGFTSQNMYFNTFGGNEVSAAVGHAVLNVLRDEKLLENALTVGEYVLAGMRELQTEASDHWRRSRPGNVFRGRDWSPTGRPGAAATTKRIVNAMRERGVLISRIGPHDNILKIRPPMVFTGERRRAADHAGHCVELRWTKLRLRQTLLRGSPHVEARWPLQCASIQPIKVRENAVYAVHLRDGGKVVLRVHRCGYHSDEALQSERTWMQALEDHGIEVPRHVLSSAGRSFERFTSRASRVSARLTCFTGLRGNSWDRLSTE